MGSIVGAVLARGRAMSPKQVVVAVASTVIAMSGAAAFAAGWTALGFASLALLQLLAIAMMLMMMGGLSHRLESGFSSFSGFPSTRRAHGGMSAPLGLGAVRYYARSNDGKQSELVQQLVLNRSLDGRDILAYQATQGRLSFDGIRSLLEGFRSPPKRGKVRKVARTFDRASLLWLARTLYRQDVTASDRINAIGLYELVEVVFGRRALGMADREWVVSALIREGHPSRALVRMESLGLTPDNTSNYHLLRANAVNPFIQGAQGDTEEWLGLLSHAYVASGLDRLELLPGRGTPFERLSAQATPGTVDGPLVSVIMPVYRADANTAVAIRSVLEQTWKNLELIIVDDGSPQQHRAALSRLAQQDSRIKLIHCTSNRGAYTARNIGLNAARGEFVTCHDADDWSHPQKIEVQAGNLVRNPERIANLSNLLRVDADLEVRHRSPAQTLAHKALISLMFRRPEVMARIGYWDSVRKMGDAEFLFRMEAAFDTKIEVVCDPPLYYALHDPDSLSGSDMRLGYMDPERRIYRARYRDWHRRIATGEAAPYLPMDARPRPFPAPSSFLPERSECEEFDVVFVSELGFTGGNVHSLVHEMEICVQAGLKVGLVHVRNLLFTHLATRDPVQALNDLVVSGKVSEIAMTKSARAQMVIVRWPACFQYTSVLKCGIQARRTIIVANHPPYERHQDRHSYEMGQVTDNVRAAFGAEPQWAPQSATIRRMLEPQLPRSALLDVDWVAVLGASPARRVGGRSAPADSVPVIGRHSRDHHLKWPESRDMLLSVYPSDGSVKVRVLGGVKRVIDAGALTEEDVTNWEVHAFDAMSPSLFLESIDFFVYYHHKDWVEAFGRVIMEAMFAGAVVVLPPSFEAVFGDAAVYAEPDQVQALIHEYYEDWPRFQAQSERGLAYAHQNCTPSAYRRRLARLGVEALQQQELRAEQAPEGGEGSDAKDKPAWTLRACRNGRAGRYGDGVARSHRHSREGEMQGRQVVGISTTMDSRGGNDGGQGTAGQAFPKAPPQAPATP